MKDLVISYCKISLLEERLIQHSSAKCSKNDILIVLIYVDDIIFGSANSSLCQECAKLMQAGFEISQMDELKLLLEIQKQQHPEATYIHQERRKAE